MDKVSGTRSMKTHYTTSPIEGGLMSFEPRHPKYDVGMDRKNCQGGLTRPMLRTSSEAKRSNDLGGRRKELTTGGADGDRGDADRRKTKTRSERRVHEGRGSAGVDDGGDRNSVDEGGDSEVARRRRRRHRGGRSKVEGDNGRGISWHEGFGGGEGFVDTFLVVVHVGLEEFMVLCEVDGLAAERRLRRERAAVSSPMKTSSTSRARSTRRTATLRSRARTRLRTVRLLRLTMELTRRLRRMLLRRMATRLRTTGALTSKMSRRATVIARARRSGRLLRAARGLQTLSVGRVVSRDCVEVHGSGTRKGRRRGRRMRIAMAEVLWVDRFPRDKKPYKDVDGLGDGLRVAEDNLRLDGDGQAGQEAVEAVGLGHGGGQDGIKGLELVQVRLPVTVRQPEAIQSCARGCKMISSLETSEEEGLEVVPGRRTGG